MIKGMDKLKENLNKIQSNVKALEGKVQFKDLLTHEFLVVNTKFSSVEDMFEKSGYKVVCQDDLKAIPDSEWDEYISSNSNFKSWKEMLSAAAAELFKKRLASSLN